MILVEIHEGCPLACAYCYVRPFRAILRRPFQPEAFREAIRSLGHREAALHGSEPFAAPLALLEAVVGALKEEGYEVSAQTCALPLEEEAVLAFVVEEGIRLGISWDGVGEGGRLRHPQRALGERVLRVMERLRREGQTFGCILVLNERHREKDLRESLLILKELGAAGVRLNPVHAPWRPLAPERYLALLEAAADFLGVLALSPLDWLLGRTKERSCAFSGCSLTGTVCVGVLLDGTAINCIKDRVTLYGGPCSFRSELLRRTPFEEGGCGGCPWFSRCHGGCPAHAEHELGRTRYCEVWRHFFRQTSAPA